MKEQKTNFQFVTTALMIKHISLKAFLLLFHLTHIDISIINFQVMSEVYLYIGTHNYIAKRLIETGDRNAGSVAYSERITASGVCLWWYSSFLPVIYVLTL